MACILSNIQRLSMMFTKNGNSYYLVFGRHVAANYVASIKCANTDLNETCGDTNVCCTSQ